MTHLPPIDSVPGRTPKTNKQKVAEYDARRRQRGEVKLCVWVPDTAEARQLIKTIAEQLCHAARKRLP